MLINRPQDQVLHDSRASSHLCQRGDVASKGESPGFPPQVLGRDLGSAPRLTLPQAGKCWGDTLSHQGMSALGIGSQHPWARVLLMAT